MTKEEMWKEFENQLVRETRTPMTMSYDASEKMIKFAIKETVAKWKERLEQQPCDDCVSRQAVNELFDSKIKMYEARIETRKGSNYYDQTERIKEFRSRIANAEYWQDKIKALPPITPTIPTSDDCIARQPLIDNWNSCADMLMAEGDSEIVMDWIFDAPPVTPAQRWIPVSERLPASDEDVLVTNGKGMYIGWIDPTDKCWRVDSEGEYFMNDIVAWQPLPKPYEEKRGSEK